MKKKINAILILTMLGAMLTLPYLSSAQSTTTGTTIHIVNWGETLYSIARRYGTTVAAISALNGISNPSYIYTGQRLLIPSGVSAYPTTGGTYVVQRGDTMYSIARRLGLTVNALAQANNVYNPSYIYAGQVLVIPGYAQPAPQPAVIYVPGSYYTVQAGDTLSSIALRYGTTTWAIAIANNISNPSLIRVGQVLFIPSVGAAAPTSPPAPTATPYSGMPIVGPGQTGPGGGVPAVPYQTPVYPYYPTPYTTGYIYSAPWLVSPPNTGETLHKVSRLEWSGNWDRWLAEDEYFDVRIWKEGEPHWGIGGWSKTTYKDVDLDEVLKGQSDEYYWAVAIIRGSDDGRMLAQLSPESEAWKFYYQWVNPNPKKEKADEGAAAATPTEIVPTETPVPPPTDTPTPYPGP